MPFQALRFVHAASLLVDHQLHDVGTVGDSLKPSLINATTTAFERLVEICVDQEVDFLLLTGDTFCESDRSLRARVALREGLEMLREAEIEVFIVPGPLDPLSAWQEFPDLPDNVSLFVPETDEPTAVMRDGNVVATIQACTQRSGISQRSETPSPADADSMPALRTSPLRVSIMPPIPSGGAEPDRSRIEKLLQSQSVDYIAVPLPFSRLTAIHGDRMAHCPGPVTSISRQHRGVCGSTLVSIDEDARITTRQIALSPVRREAIEIAVPADMSWDELIAAMRERVDRIEQLESSQVALFDWRFTGTGELLSSFDDKAAVAELFEFLAADTTTLADLEVSHTLQISAMSDAQAEAAWQQHARREASGEKANPFISGLFRRLDESRSIAHEVVDAAKESSESDSPWVQRLEEIVSRVSPQAVTAHARRHGAAWFQTGVAVPETECEGEDAPQADLPSPERTAISPSPVRFEESVSVQGQASPPAQDSAQENSADVVELQSTTEPVSSEAAAESAARNDVDEFGDGLQDDKDNFAGQYDDDYDDGMEDDYDEYDAA